MIEALAYLGGTVVLVGAMLIGAQYWADLSVGARLVIVAATAVVLLAAGFAIPAGTGAVPRRLRSILWLLSTAAGAAFWALLGHQALHWAVEDTALMTGLATAVYAALLWAVTRAALQQIAAFVSTLITAGTIGAHLDGAAWPGIAVWITSVAWLVAGRAEVTATKRLTQSLAAAGLVFGAILTMPDDVAIVFALTTTIALICAGVIWREIPVVLIGSIGLVQILPVAVTTWFSGRAAAPVALVFGGGLLVVAAVVLARRTVGASASDSAVVAPERYDAVVFSLEAMATDIASVQPLLMRLLAAEVDWAVISTRRDSAEVLRSTGLADLFRIRVDDVTAADLALPGKPDPAVYLLAARRLGVHPHRTVIVENESAGVAAGRAGGFGLVIGLDRTGRSDVLLGAGANVVVRDLDEVAVTSDQATLR